MGTVQNLQLKNEYPFTKEDFDNLRHILTSQTGIELQDTKMQLMYSRLVRRLRVLELKSFDAYYKHLQDSLKKGKDDELLVMINAMTTNVTHFFREHHHFDFLAEHLDEILQKHGKVRIWSCAASIGAEPWSIAMVVEKYKRSKPNADIKILATDIDSSVLEKCQIGKYDLNPEVVAANEYLQKYLIPTKEPLGPGAVHNHINYKIDDKLRKHVEFKKLNLLHDWAGSIEKNFHFIFCRNVIIYFSKETQKTLFKKIDKKLPEDSYLFLGHSESLVNVSANYKSLGHTTYKRLTDA
tara:strand:+ start:118263 stop:119150 length:888 start_codon:yes stop_codon:yes gene_type:complete